MAKPTDELEPETIARRRDAGIRRALNTPPSPTKAIKGKTREKPKNVLTKAQAKKGGPGHKD